MFLLFSEKERRHLLVLAGLQRLIMAPPVPCGATIVGAIVESTLSSGFCAHGYNIRHWLHDVNSSAHFTPYYSPNPYHTCSTCSGYGYATTTVTCSTCSSSGVRSCSGCDGTGQKPQSNLCSHDYDVDNPHYYCDTHGNNVGEYH